jgi:sugar-phosphatase
MKAADFDAALFDMDGLLIDSEPHWQDAELAVYRPHGVPVDRELCRASAGRRIDEVLTGWHERFDWTGPPVEVMVRQVMAEVTRRILDHGESLPGVHATIDALRAQGLKIAIASSSPYPLIDAVIAKLDLADRIDVTHSGVDEARSKPDPAVFLSAAAKLGIAPGRCLVFEDAPAGVAAGKAAGMKVVAVPSVFSPDEPGFEDADILLDSLERFALHA